MKKILSILTALSVMVSALCTVTAAKTGWSVKVVGSFTAKAEAAQLGNDVYDGTLAMSIECRQASKEDGRYIEIKNILSSSVTIGKYKLEFYAKKADGVTEPEVVIGAYVINCADITPTTSDKDGWNKYSTEFDYSGDEVGSLSFRFYSRAKSYIIDNVSLKADGSDTNLITDSGFETIQPDSGDDGEDDEGDDSEQGGDGEQGGNIGGDDNQNEGVITNAYAPAMVKLSEGTNLFGLSFVNPQVSTIKKISVYDITGGKEELVSDSLITTSGGRNYLEIPNLTDEKYYQYKIVFSFSDNEDFTYYIGDYLRKVEKNRITTQFGSWYAMPFFTGSAGYAPLEYSIDRTNFVEGNAALKIESSIDFYGNSSLFGGNIYFQLHQSLKMVSGSSYKISFWIKGENVGKNVAFRVSGENLTGGKVVESLDGSDSAVSTGTYDWKKLEYTYTNGKTDLAFLLDGLADSFWIDDVQVYKLDEDGEITGDNLVSDGGFENWYKANEASFLNFKATTDTSSVTFSWNEFDSNYDGAKMYRKYGDEYICIGKISPDLTEFRVDGLKWGEEYTYKIVPLNSDGVEGTPQEITVSPVVPKYAINEPVISKVSNGKYISVVSVKNNSLGKDLNFEQIVVVYNGNTLDKIYSEKFTVAESSIKEKFTDCKVEFELPDGYNVRVYTIDSRENLEWYVPRVIFPANN